MRTFDRSNPPRLLNSQLDATNPAAMKLITP